MTFDKVKALCKKAKVITLFNTDDCQWLGDDKAIYPLYEHPEYNKDTIANVLSLDEKKKSEMRYNIGDFPLAFNHNDTIKDEKLCGVFGVSISWMGESLIPLQTSQGLKVIQSKYISPVIKDNYEFYERKSPQGKVYIAIKVGFMLEAIVTPCHMYVSESLVTELYNLAESASEAVTNSMNEEGLKDD